MSNILAAVMMLGGPILAIGVVVGIVALVVLVANDFMDGRREAKPELSQAEEAHLHFVRSTERAQSRIWIERGVARGFVILGAAFWGIMSLTAAILYDRGAESLLFIALIPFLMNVASLIVGWRFERVASLMLGATAVAAIVWAAAHSFELGVWMLFVALLIGPMMTAAVLFWLARQGEVDLAMLTAPQSELVEVPAES